MKALTLLTTVAVGVTLAAASAEAAKKRKPGGVPHAAVAKSDPYVVRAYDGDILGRDPDPFIRLMLLKDGKIRDQHAR
jgi:hypothetical protein